MTKIEVATEVAERISRSNPELGVTPQSALTIINTLASTIKGAVSGGQPVYIRTFGTFAPKTRAAKIGQNISKGEAVQIPETVKPYFKPAREFAEQVRTGKA